MGIEARRPGLEYRHALDLCAMEAHHAGSPITVFASSVFYAGELVRRMAGCRGALVGSGGWATTGDSLASLLGPELPGACFDLVGEVGALAPGRAAVWAEQEIETSERLVAMVAKSLEPGSRLCVVTSGWLRRGLPEWKGEGERPARRPAGLRRTVQRLRQGGFDVEAVYGFHGPQSLAWGFASRLPSALGREDLVDRCQARVRKTYVVGGWQARWAPVAVVLARKR